MAQNSSEPSQDTALQVTSVQLAAALHSGSDDVTPNQSWCQVLSGWQADGDLAAYFSFLHIGDRLVPGNH